MAKKFMVIDLEATCFPEDELPEKWFQEIIEVGAVIVDPDKLETVYSYGEFVKPVLFPVLSNFCKNLTTISQGEVDFGISFKKSIEVLHSLYEYYDKPIFTSFGRYDYNQIERQCKRFNVEFPFEKNIHCNIKQEFGKFYNLNFFRGVSMKVALKRYGIVFEGTQHRGIDDAKNIAKILIGMLKDGYKFDVQSTKGLV